MISVFVLHLLLHTRHGHNQRGTSMPFSTRLSNQTVAVQMCHEFLIFIFFFFCIHWTLNNVEGIFNAICKQSILLTTCRVFYEIFWVYYFFSSPVRRLCHTHGVVRRMSHVMCRLCPP